MYIYYLLAILFAILDQLVKLAVVKQIPLGDEVNVIPGILSFFHIRNTGAAWSMLEGQMWFFTVITLLAVVAVSYLLAKYGKTNGWLFSLSLSMILGGTFGNYFDRMRLGYVVDMFKLDFINFPIFNIADIELTVGVTIMFIYIIFEERFKHQ